MRRILPLLLVLLSLTSMVTADPLYKWVDDQGNVHYSDKPQPGAKKLNLPLPSTFTPAVPAAPPDNPVNSDTRFRNRHSDANKSGDGKQATAYSDFVITAPQANQVLWNVTSVSVSVSVKPGLQPGDRVTITLDNKVVGPQEDANASFDDLDRGEHTVSANLQTADGAVLVAQPITFFIQRGTQKKPTP